MMMGAVLKQFRVAPDKSASPIIQNDLTGAIQILKGEARNEQKVFECESRRRILRRLDENPLLPKKLEGDFTKFLSDSTHRRIERHKARGGN
jgi:hypothetical protein